MIILPAKNTDAQQIAAIFNQYLGIATMVLEARSAADYQVIIEANNCAVFVAKASSGEVIGFAYVKPYSDRTKNWFTPLR